MKRIIFFILLCPVFNALALTTEQNVALKAGILAEPSITLCVTSGDDNCVAQWLNSDSTYIVWRTNVLAEEYHNDAIVWTSVDQLTVGKARIWEWMSKYQTINPSKTNIRQGFADAFGAASATVTAALAISKRAAKNGERILATGTGTNAAPGLLTFEGNISAAEVAKILRG